jgi:hypothetical protein
VTQPWPAPNAQPTAGVTERLAERRVLAIGTSGGVTSGFAGIRDGDGLVRLGASLRALSEDEYKLWSASQLAPAVGPLLEQAGQAGVQAPGRTLLELEAAGLVITCADDPASVQHMAAGLTVRLTGRLIGNGPHQSPRFLVSAGAGAPALRVDVVVYQFLLWADGKRSIAQICTEIDTGPQGARFDAAGHVVGWIPALLRASLVGLDLAGAPDGSLG